MLIAIGAGIVGVIVIMMYNGLIVKKNAVTEAYSGIDVQLKKRYDLIPNLVETVKGYMEHEKSVLESLTKLRSQAMQATNTEDIVDLNNQVTSLLGTVKVAMENYPDLKASQNFSALQRSLTEMESQLSASRRFYNSAVTDFNNGIEMFPTNILAGLMGFRRKKVFQVQEDQRENLDVGNVLGR
ncbi:MAG: LemA family protein [Pseudomonadota bacterium]